MLKSGKFPVEREKIGVAKKVQCGLLGVSTARDESKTCTDPEKVNPRYFIKEGDFPIQPGEYD